MAWPFNREIVSRRASKRIIFTVLLSLTTIARSENSIDLYYHIEAELIERSESGPPHIIGENHIRIINDGIVPLNKIYIRNNSNRYFNDKITSTPRTVIGKIEGDLVKGQPVWTQTVMEVMFSKPLMPADETVIHVPFETVISEKSGQYYPTIGSLKDTTIYVLESFYPRLEYLYPDGWRVTEYKKHTREHKPAADYLVELTIPENFTIASSGVLLSGQEGKKAATYVYASHNTREFTVIASNMFKRDRINVQGMAVTLMMPKGHLESFRPMKAVIRKMLTYYTEEFGKGSSPELTITTAFSLGTDMASHPNLLVLSPGYLNNEKAIAHELAHQWFGNKGAFELPDDEWFFESLAEYASGEYYAQKKARAELFSKKPTFDYSLNDLRDNITQRTFVEWVQLAYEVSGDNSLPPFYEGEKKKWEQVVDRYSVYAIGSYTLQMLKETLGRAKMNAILNEFVQMDDRLPLSAGRFLSIVEHNTNEKISRQFVLALTTAARADLLIKDVFVKKGEGTFSNNVIIDCEGKWLFPVNVSVITESGENMVFTNLRYAMVDTLKFESKSRIKKVEIDPDNKMYDANRYNNRWPRSFAPQPLTEIPSWKVYSLYFRPRAFSGWDGGQRLGVRYSGRVGINLMPYQSALYQHSFDLDILFAVSRASNNWGWSVNYRTPVRSTDLMFWRFTAEYDFPRNTEELSFVFYIGKPEYWAVDGRSAYKRLTSNISRIEFTSSDSTSWWRKSQSWALKEQFIWFNYTGEKRQILRTSIMSGIYVFSGEKHRISKLSASFDYEKHHVFGIIARGHIDGGLSYGAYPNNSYKFRIRRVSRGWKNRENYIPLFRGRAVSDEEWQSSVLSAGTSLGIETSWYVWPMIYSDVVVTSGQVPHNDIKRQLKQLMKADPLYIATGIGVESQSIIELGIYLPIWISHPPTGEDHFGLRFQIQAGFYF